MPFSIFHSRQPSLDRHNVTRKLYTHIRAFHPSGLTHAHACVNVLAEYAPGTRSPALFPSPSAPFCFFFLASSSVLYSLALSSSFTVHLLGAVLAWLRHCFARTRWTHVGVRFRAVPLPHFLRFSSSFFHLFYFTRTYFLRRAYRASQRITFMGFPEIKRIPCRGLGARKFRRRASDANHLESGRHKTCFGFSFLMMH